MTTLTPDQIASMQSTVADVELLMTCTVQRNTPGAANAWGQPAEVWATLHANLPCFWWTQQERQVLGPDIHAIVSRQYLAVPAGTDITEKDRVAAVTLSGLPVAGPLRITEVRPRVVDTILGVTEIGGTV